jgi:hypothetical protein
MRFKLIFRWPFARNVTRTAQTKRRLFFFTILIAVYVAGHGIHAAEGEERDKLAVQHTVLRYTQLLAEGYAKMDMTPLQEVATEEQALKAYYHMSALGAGKIRMESQLIDIDFLDTRLVDQDSAVVVTREKWNYTHIRTDIPGQTVVSGLIYDIAYELVRQDGRWLVSSVSILKEDKAENTSYDGASFA